MQKKKSSLIKNILSLTFVQLISYLAPIIILPYLSRILNVESFGLSMLLTSIILLSLLLTDFGFNLYSPSWIAKNQDDKKAISKFVSSIFLLKSVLFLATSLIIFIYIHFSSTFAENKLLISFITILAVFSQTFQMTWLFQGIERMANITLLTFLSKLSYIVLIIATVNEKNDVSAVIFSYAISNIFAVVLGIYLFYRMGYSLLKVNLKESFIILKSSFPFFLSRASVGGFKSEVQR